MLPIWWGARTCVPLLAPKEGPPTPVGRCPEFRGERHIAGIIYSVLLKKMGGVEIKVHCKYRPNTHPNCNDEWMKWMDEEQWLMIASP